MCAKLLRRPRAAQMVSFDLTADFNSITSGNPTMMSPEPSIDGKGTAQQSVVETHATTMVSEISRFEGKTKGLPISDLRYHPWRDAAEYITIWLWHASL
jgi:hypothetical protein